MATATTSAPFGVTPPPQPTAPDFTQYLATAAAQLAPGSTDVYNAITAQGTQAQSDAATTVADINADKTIAQQTYADLSKEFATNEGIETGQAQQTGQANVGAARVANAAAGVTNATGAFNAPVASAQVAEQNTVAQIAEKYGAQQTDITDTLNANIQQLQDKADAATAQGNDAYAAALTQVAQLKYQQQQQTVTLAQQMATAESQYEQENWKDYMDEVNAQHQQETLDVMNGRLAVEEQNSAVEAQKLDIEEQQLAGPQKATNSAGGLSFTDKNGNPIDAATYAKNTGQDLISVVSQSKDPTDQAFVSDYNSWNSVIQNPSSPDSQKFLSSVGVSLASTSSEGDIKDQAEAYLTEQYPNIGAVTLP
jgi:hypothetical protein